MTTTQDRPGGVPDFSRLRLGQVPIVLMYHMIADVPEDPHKLAVAPARFAEQMAWLAERGLRGVSMETLMAAMRAGRARGLAGLTFDDGYLSVLEDALPVLLRHDFTATMFIISDRIGGTNEWDAGTGPVWPLMTAAQVAQVAAAGMEIGSHTATHPRLPGIAADQVTAEISGSRARLRELFDLPVTGFAYPYGRMDATARQAVRDAGYGYACSVETPVSLLGDMTLPRITFYDRDGAGRMAAKKLFFRSYTAALGTRRGLSYSPLARQVRRTLTAPLHRLCRLRRGACQQERPQPLAYHVDVEVAGEPCPRVTRRGRQRGRRVEQLEKDGCGAGRVIQRPEAGFRAVLAEFRYGADARRDDGQPGGHRLDDRERGGLRVRGVRVGPVGRKLLPHVGAEAEQPDLSVQVQRADPAREVPAERAVAVDVQRDAPPFAPGFDQDVEEEPVVLRLVQPADGDEIGELFPLPLHRSRGRDRRHAVADHLGRHVRRLGQPAQQRVPRPP